MGAQEKEAETLAWTQGNESLASISYVPGWRAFCWAPEIPERCLCELTLLATRRDGCVQQVFIHDLMVHVAEALGNQHGPGAPFL